MNINKQRNERKKYIYDGNRIIKKGSKELYPYVYKRIWDLTEYDETLLNEYGLKKALYLYIGSSSKYNLRKRCTDWKIAIAKDKINVSKDIRDFIKALNKFYELETNYSNEDIDFLLYYNASVIGRCDNRNQAYKLEKNITSKYHSIDFMGEIVEPHIILLSKIDSNLKERELNGVKIIKAKNNLG